MRPSFIQDTSFIERLRIILLVIAAFFILGIMGLYFSSRGFLSGLQEISQTNRILNHTGTALQALNSSTENLEKINGGLTEQRIAPYREASRLALENIDSAIKIARFVPEINAKLIEGRQAVESYQSSVEALVSRTDLESEDFKSDILISRQFAMDAEEGLREAQILLKNESDSIFKSIYNNRFDPLIVAGLLSLAFFAFVVLVGLSSARRLGLSLSNLANATDAVSAGNLTYEAPIIENDEFGKLTFEFNRMVQTLNDKQHKLTEAIEKVTRLQSITNSFSGALIPDEVFEVIVHDVYRALRADAGGISQVTEDGRRLTNRIIGFTKTDETLYASVSIDYHSPMVTAIKKREALFFDDVASMREEYPEVLQVHQQNNIISIAYLPLITGDQVYGGVSFGFRIPRHFSQEDREFIMALTRQCAQALHRAKLFQSANDAIQVRDEFLSIASHELRTPLTPLKLQLQNMSRQVRRGSIVIDKPDLVLKIVENSDKQVDRLINLIDDLLDVSRISAGKLTLNSEVFNMGEMVEEVVNHYTSQMKDAHEIVHLDVDKNIMCSADRVRMEQVVINFLTNAVKYAPGKPIHVKLSRSGDNAQLEVRDEGEGISIENQARIFDRFERVRDKNNIGGLGLGLYICRQIIEAHQGEISVKSAPGRGSTFIVEIPAIS